MAEVPSPSPQEVALLEEVPAPVNKLAGTVFETRSQADSSRRKLTRNILTFISLGGLSLIGYVWHAANQVIATVQMSSTDHGVIEAHSAQILENHNKTDYNTARIDSLFKTMDANQNLVLNAIKDSDDKTQKGFQQVNRSIGRLEGATGLTAQKQQTQGKDDAN